MFTIEVDKAAVIAHLDAMGPNVVAALKGPVARAATTVQAHVINDKLSGQVLQQRSGALARSIQQESPLVEDHTVWARIFSAGDVKYAAIQEYGGRTGPHEIVPDKAKALAFMIAGRQVFAKIVHHPGSTIPERSYLRSGLTDLAVEIVASIKTAAVEAMQFGAASSYQSGL